MSSSRRSVMLCVAALLTVLVGLPLSQQARGQCHSGGGGGRGGSPGLGGGGMIPVGGGGFQQQQQLQTLLLQQQMLQQQYLQVQDLNRQVRELSRSDLTAVEEALQSSQVETRWAAARVVALKSLPLQDGLIGLLTDSNAHVRQAAREGLVRLGTAALRKSKGRTATRRVDFGPVPSAGPAAREAAARKWRDWWDRMDSSQADRKAVSSSSTSREPATRR